MKCKSPRNPCDILQEVSDVRNKAKSLSIGDRIVQTRCLARYQLLEVVLHIFKLSIIFSIVFFEYSVASVKNGYGLPKILAEDVNFSGTMTS